MCVVTWHPLSFPVTFFKLGRAKLTNYFRFYYYYYCYYRHYLASYNSTRSNSLSPFSSLRWRSFPCTKTPSRPSSGSSLNAPATSWDYSTFEPTQRIEWVRMLGQGSSRTSLELMKVACWWYRNRAIGRQGKQCWSWRKSRKEMLKGTDNEKI